MKKILAWTIALALCLGLAAPAMAANVFAFTEKALVMFEGETAATALRREGTLDGEGEITYSSSNEAVASVDADGTVTGAGKGQATITAVLKRNGRQAAKAQLKVKVQRAVKEVALDTAALSVYDPLDDAVVDLLQEETARQVIVVPAGSAVKLQAACSPEDASDRKVSFETTDPEVAKVTGNSMKGVQAGECDLVISSVLNPEVREIFRVLVIRPVKKVTVSAENRKVAVGSAIQLTAGFEPEDAAIRAVTWTSRNPAIATVDENGAVTGVKRGTATIVATAADGSKKAGAIQVTVTQPVTGITFAKETYTVNTKRSVQVRPKVLPANASDTVLTWTSSDEAVATVKNGVITGVKAGACTITCASRSDPDVTASVTVEVHQPVTKIECANSAAELSLLVGESVQLSWNVYPDDATDKALKYRPSHGSIISVDANGLVTGVGRGITSVTATAQDGSGKQGTAKITVIQPVTGVSLRLPKYYIQYKGTGRITATVEPNNANHKNVYWTSDDESIATVRSSGTQTGLVYGAEKGTTFITAITEDGGFTASTDIWVDDFNGAVIVEDVFLSRDDEIMITLKNTREDMTFGNVYFTVECFDDYGAPIICNTDGVSTWFEGSYPTILGPLERSAYQYIRFKNFLPSQPFAGVRVTITGWYDSDGYSYTIPEENRVTVEWPRLDGEGVG